MNLPIHLIATGQTRFGEWWEKSLRNLLEDAVDAALENAPCTPLDIDLVIVANMIGERVSDQAHLGSLVSSFLPHRPPALRVEAACGSGSLAIHTACAMLESGRAKTVLVVGGEKMTDASTDDIASALMGAAESELDRPSGLTFPGIFGLIAQRYMYEYGLTREELNVVSAMHHRNAVENPFAQFRMAIAPEKIAQSPLVADPLCLLDCSPISDGAAAVILSTEFQSPLHLRASQIQSDSVSITERETITSFPATRNAMERALREATIAREDLSAIETHDCFSIAAIINLEDLGFADPGEGIGLYRALYEDTASLPFTINGSGGLKACGHPVAATGVKQLIDVSKQLTTRKQRFGLTHNFGGAGATCGIHILENQHV